MERRAGAHTEEEELNQRRRLLNLARKGDPKAISRLFELYQVRVYTGDQLNRWGKLPEWPKPHDKRGKKTTRKKVGRKPSRKPARTARRTAAKRSASRKPTRKPVRRHR